MLLGCGWRDALDGPRRSGHFSDPPEKVSMSGSRAGSTRPSIRDRPPPFEINVYFILEDEGAALRRLVERGAEVKVLDHLLAATDVAAVHGAYAHYREALLESGIGLFELKAESATRAGSRCSAPAMPACIPRRLPSTSRPASSACSTTIRGPLRPQYRDGRAVSQRRPRRGSAARVPHPQRADPCLSVEHRGRCPAMERRTRPTA